MKNRFLYLLGGNPSLFEANLDFIEKAGGADARIALLIMNSPKWERFLPAYTNVWEQIGISSYEVIIPDENTVLNYEKTKLALESATGIYIGGGDTNLYHYHYAGSPIKELIQQRYHDGIPVAGCSAGALIMLDKSFISPEDSKTTELEYIEGISLLKNTLIGVHYTEEHQQPYLEKAMDHFDIHEGYGIDEASCAFFENEKYVKSLGSEVHILQKARNLHD